MGELLGWIGKEPTVECDVVPDHVFHDVPSVENFSYFPQDLLFLFACVVFLVAYLSRALSDTDSDKS